MTSLQKCYFTHIKLKVIGKKKLCFLQIGVVFVVQISTMAVGMTVLCRSATSRPKYLYSYRMDCHEILCRQSWSPENDTLMIPWLFLSCQHEVDVVLVLSEMSRQLLDELPWDLVPLVRVPSGWISAVCCARPASEVNRLIDSATKNKCKRTAYLSRRNSHTDTVLFYY